MKLVTSQRVAILVDSENLEHSVSEYFKPAPRLRRSHAAYPDWKVIIPELLGSRKLIRNIYYKKHGQRVSPKFQAVWEKELGGEVRQPIKSVDPYIIVDAISLCGKVDTIIILAGDKDYLPLVWYLKSNGCKVEVASFKDAAAQRIREAADRFVELGKEHTIVVKRSREVV